jgi:hypothetical protein
MKKDEQLMYFLGQLKTKISTLAQFSFNDKIQMITELTNLEYFFNNEIEEIFKKEPENHGRF